jgi:hypothetical protein
MRQRLLAGICLLAFTFAASGVADAAKRKAHHSATNCAQPSEISAIQATAIQQQLMVAALSCDQTDASGGKQFVDKFNQFQTVYGPELRRSDAALLSMFKRLYGVRKGDDEYNAFKTRAASHSESRRIHGFGDFCKAANIVYEAALAPAKPSLSDFVSGVQVQEDNPVNSCAISVTFGLAGAQAAINLKPKPKPDDL